MQSTIKSKTMKKNQIIKLATLFAGGIGFNILFWSENLGINLLLFSIFLLIAGFATNPLALKSKPALASAAGVILTGVMVVLHNSFIAKFTCMTSMVMFVGFLNQIELKAIFHAIPTSFWNFGSTPMSIYKSTLGLAKADTNMNRYVRTLKIVAIPLLFFITFYVIFHYSNPVFASYSNKFWETIGQWFIDVFGQVSLPWIILLFFGTAIVAWVLYQTDLVYFLNIEKGRQKTITREFLKLKKNRRRITFQTLDLKYEYRSALVLIVSINALLLVINSIDISSLWFSFKYDDSMNLSQFVHEGTYLLILSILLSMGILLYFFRKNLNFYFKKKTLATLATIWIFQNLILVISVAVRNYHYIHHFGLAYKRIGVIIFLIATIVGLVTLFIKINKTKSSYYLLLVNSWSVYVLLILMSIINWDMVIVKHNINHANEKNIDVEFLLTLSDKTLPILLENSDRLDLDRHMDFYGHVGAVSDLDLRIKQFKRRKNQTTWRSWNYAEQQALEQLKKLEK